MSNVYAAPVADLSNAISSGETMPFALNGRIGRLRYLSYSMGIYVILACCMIALMFPLSKLSHGADAVVWLPGALTLTFLIAYVIIARRRLHDIGLGGWTVLCMLIPFVNLYFGLVMTFKRGDEGSNEFGPQPSANSWGVKALVFGLPALLDWHRGGNRAPRMTWRPAHHFGKKTCQSKA